MRVVGICRIGSLNLGEPLPVCYVENSWKDLMGRPAIWHVMERLKKAKKIDEVVIFGEEVSQRECDLVKKLGWNFHLVGNLGAEDNLEKFIKFLKEVKADVTVGIPSSWALIDPEFVDLMVEYFISNKLDILEIDTSFLNGTTPILVFLPNVFQKLKEIEKSNFKKGEILKTWLLIARERPELFKRDVMFTDRTLQQASKLYFGGHDSKGMALVRRVYERCYKPGEIINLSEVLSLYEKEPGWFKFLPEYQLEIEVTNDCNLKCIMCPRTSKMKRGIGYLDFGLFKKILDETRASSVHFSGLGEPLLHSQIKEMFAYAKEKAFQICLWTSGLELTEEFSEEIIEKGLLDYLIFGLDAATKETYAKVKGVDVFDKIMENINRFLELKKKILKDTLKYYGHRKPLVGVQIVKMKENDQEIEQFMERWDLQEKAKKMVNYRNRVEKDPEINTKLWETLYDKFLPVEHATIGHFDRYCDQIEDRSAIDVTPLKRFSCRQLNSSPTILWNGNILLCRHDINGEYLLGNLREQDMESIRKKIEEIWQAHRAGKYDKFPPCTNCKEWYYDLYA